MSSSDNMILGEFSRTVDQRFRLTLPPELAESLARGHAELAECVLVKERLGCLSLWNAETWREKFEPGIELVRQKIRTGRLEAKLARAQLFGRLLSTRSRTVRVGQRGRLVVPEGFREFLAVEPGSEVLIIGAAVCVEIWQPQAWREYLRRRMPRFARLFEELSR